MPVVGRISKGSRCVSWPLGVRVRILIGNEIGRKTGTIAAVTRDSVAVRVRKSGRYEVIAFSPSELRLLSHLRPVP